MEHLPILLPALFISTTFLTLWLLYRAALNKKRLLVIIFIWLLLQAVLTLAGFYLITSENPPRFTLLVLPPVILGLFVVFSRSENFDIKKLALLHIVRLPVELILYGLYINHAIPQLMTFEGGNLDILSGLSAPFIYYFAFVKKSLSRGWIIAWNVVCLLLLFNIVGRAILSAPFSFQRFGFDQPNIAVMYFPYSWLPCFVVPAVLFAHLITLRKLIFNK
jgi:hypothetical protein